MPKIDLLKMGLKHINFYDQLMLARMSAFTWNRLHKITVTVSHNPYKYSFAMWMNKYTSLVYEYEGSADIEEVIHTIKTIGFRHIAKADQISRVNEEAYRIFSSI